MSHREVPMRRDRYTQLTRAGACLVCGMDKDHGSPHYKDVSHIIVPSAGAPAAELAERTLSSVPVVGVPSNESFLGRKQPSEFTG